MVATTKELALSKNELEWLSAYLGEVENSPVYVESSNITIGTRLSDETPFKMAWRTDASDSEYLPHILIRVPK